MIIFTQYLRRLLRYKMLLAIMFALPLLTMFPQLTGMFKRDVRVRVGFVDGDRTSFTRFLRERLAREYEVLPLQEAQAKRALIESKVDYVVVLPAGATARLFSGAEPGILGFIAKKRAADLGVGRYLEGYLQTARRLAAGAGGDAKRVWGGLDLYAQAPIRMIVETVPGGSAPQAVETFGMLIQFMLFGAVFAATLLLTDKENRTLYRSLIAPVRMRSYMSQAILACILLSLIQLIGVLFILAFGFGVNMQGKLAEIAAFLSVYALVAVAFGLVISSLAKTPIQGNILGVIMVPVISMLGGAWFPTEVFPDFLRKASQLVPVSWAVSGVDKLLAGGTLASLGQHTLILLLFAAVFFLLGTWKRADVAR